MEYITNVITQLNKTYTTTTSTATNNSISKPSFSATAVNALDVYYKFRIIYLCNEKEDCQVYIFCVSDLLCFVFIVGLVFLVCVLLNHEYVHFSTTTIIWYYNVTGKNGLAGTSFYAVQCLFFACCCWLYSPIFNHTHLLQNASGTICSYLEDVCRYETMFVLLLRVLLRGVFTGSLSYPHTPQTWRIHLIWTVIPDLLFGWLVFVVGWLLKFTWWTSLIEEVMKAWELMFYVIFNAGQVFLLFIILVVVFVEERHMAGGQEGPFCHLPFVWGDVEYGPTNKTHRFFIDSVTYSYTRRHKVNQLWHTCPRRSYPSFLYFPSPLPILLFWIARWKRCTGTISIHRLSGFLRGAGQRNTWPIHSCEFSCVYLPH